LQRILLRRIDLERRLIQCLRVEHRLEAAQRIPRVGDVRQRTLEEHHRLAEELEEAVGREDYDDVEARCDARVGDEYECGCENGEGERYGDTVQREIDQSLQLELI
jgi:hypothetical protein